MIADTCRGQKRHRIPWSWSCTWLRPADVGACSQTHVCSDSTRPAQLPKPRERLFHLLITNCLQDKPVPTRPYLKGCAMGRSPHLRFRSRDILLGYRKHCFTGELLMSWMVPGLDPRCCSRLECFFLSLPLFKVVTRNSTLGMCSSHAVPRSAALCVSL